jgi:hypothetical protein
MLAVQAQQFDKARLSGQSLKGDGGFYLPFPH